MKCAREYMGSWMKVGLNDEILQEVKKFMYLGATTTGNGGVALNMSNRMNGINCMVVWKRLRIKNEF